jgi:hypothetical protein
MCSGTFIEERESHPIEEAISVGLILGAEEDGGGKDALETLLRAIAIAN